MPGLRYPAGEACPSTSNHHVPIRHFDCVCEAEDEHGLDLRRIPRKDTRFCFGCGWREIHSSERCPPSEVSVRLRILLSHVMGCLAPDPKSRARLIAVAWEYMSWTWSALFSLYGIWSLPVHCRRRRRRPCVSPTRTRVPPSCPTLSCINVLTKPVSWLHPSDTSRFAISDQPRQSPIYMFCKGMLRRAFT